MQAMIVPLYYLLVVWHNVTNTGIIPLLFYAIYVAGNHLFGTVHRTKADAEVGGD